MATLREQVVELEARLKEARTASAAAMADARQTINDFREKQERRVADLTKQYNDVTAERDWLRSQLSDILGRVTEIKPAERPQLDQYGNPWR